jgi:hypothetical protein
MKTLFLHYHIYKNAGTMIDRLFYGNPGGSTHLEADDPDQTLDNDRLLKFIEANPNVTQLTSHGIKPPRPQIPGCYVVDIVFLRHPVDRFRSIYDYARAETRDGPTERAAKRLSMGDFASWMAEETPNNFYSPQTSIMGNGGSFFYPPGRVELEVAKSRTLEVRFLGTVELIPAAMFAASRYLRSLAPQMNFFAFRDPANTSGVPGTAFEDRVGRVKTELGPHRYERLLEALREDLALWECASAEVQRRYRLASQWHAKELEIDEVVAGAK